MLGNSLYLKNLKGRPHKTLCFFVRVNFTTLSSGMFKMFLNFFFLLNLHPLTKVEAAVKFEGPFYSANFYFMPFSTDEIGKYKWHLYCFCLLCNSRHNSHCVSSIWVFNVSMYTTILISEVSEFHAFAYMPINGLNIKF